MASACEAMPSNNRYHRASAKAWTAINATTTTGTSTLLLSTLLGSTPASNRTSSLILRPDDRSSYETDIIVAAVDGQESTVLVRRHRRRAKRQVRRRGDQPPVDDAQDARQKQQDAFNSDFLVAANLADSDDHDVEDSVSLLTGAAVIDASTAPLLSSSSSNSRRRANKQHRHQEDHTKLNRRKARRKSRRPTPSSAAAAAAAKTVVESSNIAVNKSPLPSSATTRLSNDKQPVRRRQQQHQKNHGQPLRKNRGQQREEVRHRLNKWGHRHIVPACDVFVQFELKSVMSGGFVVPNDRGHVVAPANGQNGWARDSTKSMWAAENWTFGRPASNRTTTLFRFRQVHDDSFQYLCPYVTKNRRPGQEKYAFELRPGEHAWDCFFQMCPAGCLSQLIHRQPPTWNGSEADAYNWVEDYRCPHSPKLPSLFHEQPVEGPTDPNDPAANEIDVDSLDNGDGGSPTDHHHHHPAPLLRMAFNRQGRPLRLSRNKKLSEIATRRLLMAEDQQQQEPLEEEEGGSARSADVLEQENADECETRLHMKYSFEVIPYPQDKIGTCYAPQRTFQQTPINPPPSLTL